MAQRPVFSVRMSKPFYRSESVEFNYNGGFAPSQKQKNIAAIHDSYRKKMPESNILEISSKSLQPLGIKLSAFNLLKYVPSIDKRIPVENVFQGGKKFAVGGPYTDLYGVTPREAKRDERLKQSGRLIGFYYENKDYPTFPMTAFYDWIYINALMENEELVEEIIKYDAFTDVEFNPNKSLNCQARAAAIFVSLYREGKTDILSSFEEFVKIY